jgi:GNAT superfamily N-acetyltransferase
VRRALRPAPSALQHRGVMIPERGGARTMGWRRAGRGVPFQVDDPGGRGGDRALVLPRPFSFCDWTSDPDDLAELLDPTARADDYVAVEDEAGSLIGFFHYKRPHGATLEIGIGLHPEWTGHGRGKSFLEAGLEYAGRRFAPKQLTLSVASFNRRAITCTNGPASLRSAWSRTGQTAASGSSSKCDVRRSEGAGCMACTLLPVSRDRGAEHTRRISELLTRR